MILFANTISPRLRYVTSFIGNEIIGKDFILTSDRNYFSEYEGAKINYSNFQIVADEFKIENISLLFEKGVEPQKITCFEFEKSKAFFKSSGDFPFDVFAASFYLISRYEEYFDHVKDEYGRYAHEQSLASKENFLSIPLVNMWIQELKKKLQQKFPTYQFRNQKIKLQLTYDIDEAYSYLHKSWWRTAGGMAKSIVTSQWSFFLERINVLYGKIKDPYDSFQWMNEIHGKTKTQPIYFFHVGSQTSRYDKNILPSVPAFRQLVKNLSKKYVMGVHPSWKSNANTLQLKVEIETLEDITEKKITTSRQHFLRFSIPHTFRNLIQAGITDDYSMGYGGVNGFRASVASPFFWYDLQNERATNLLLHPFCFMDATSFYQRKNSPEQAFAELNEYYDLIKSVNGEMIIIWHNNFLGTDKRFTGWREMYERFILERLT
ncbi:MAG: hypothetical protein EPO57_00915 [Chitinophagaceae bacterium]|nr:MAG: hypothetical protein EPO57_00915 [Chitinophagaceae bacterium]